MFIKPIPVLHWNELPEEFKRRACQALFAAVNHALPNGAAALLIVFDEVGNIHLAAPEKTTSAVLKPIFTELEKQIARHEAAPRN